MKFLVFIYGNYVRHTQYHNIFQKYALEPRIKPLMLTVCCLYNNSPHILRELGKLRLI